MFGDDPAFFSDTPNWNYGAVLAVWLIAVVLVLVLLFGRYLSRPAPGEGDRVSSVAASKTGGRVLGGYFVLLAIFLYALAVMIIFAFDDSFVQTFPWSASRRSGSTTPSRTRN